MDKSLKGKDKKDYVCIIGGANIDMIGKAQEAIITADSNPGKIKLSLGGVARNVAHNLWQLGVKHHLITAIGQDSFGEKLLKECKEIGIDLEHSLILEESSGVYMAVLDDGGEMIAAISQMDIFQQLNPKYLQKKVDILQRAKLIVVDTNISEEAILFLINLAQEQSIPLFLDVVSTTKAIKVKKHIGAFYTIKPNLTELEFLTDRKIDKEEDIKEGAECLLKMGVQEVVVSLGSEGAFYHNGKDYGRIKGFDTEVKNTTGGGDAFLAGLVYGGLLGKSLKEKVSLALGCGALTVSCYETVNSQLNKEELMEFISRPEKMKEE